MRLARGAQLRGRAIELRLLLRAVELDEMGALPELVAQADGDAADPARHLARQRALLDRGDQRGNLHLRGRLCRCFRCLRMRGTDDRCQERKSAEAHSVTSSRSMRSPSRPPSKPGGADLPTIPWGSPLPLVPSVSPAPTPGRPTRPPPHSPLPPPPPP